MSDLTEIPKGISSEDYPYYSNYPCWVPVQNSQGKKLKPIIVCKCGQHVGIGLHHVHSDGIVTNSFYHKKGNGAHEDRDGCEWHVWLKLLDYTGEEFLPNQEYQNNMEENVPRRNRIDLLTPAELSIHNAMQEVEKAGADVRLTDAINMLQKAKDLVADYVDGKS